MKERMIDLQSGLGTIVLKLCTHTKIQCEWGGGNTHLAVKLQFIYRRFRPRSLKESTVQAAHQPTVMGWNLCLETKTGISMQSTQNISLLPPSKSPVMHQSFSVFLNVLESSCMTHKGIFRNCDICPVQRTTKIPQGTRTGKGHSGSSSAVPSYRRQPPPNPFTELPMLSVDKMHQFDEGLSLVAKYGGKKIFLERRPSWWWSRIIFLK